MSNQQYEIVQWETEPAHLLNLSKSRTYTLCGLVVPTVNRKDWTGDIRICTHCANKRQHLDSTEGLEHKPKGPYETKS